MRRVGVGLAATVVAMAFLAGCRLKEDEQQPTPTRPSSVQNPPADSDAVLGSVPAAPSPTPSPDPETPQPTPTPAPGNPPPASGSCQLPPSNPANPICDFASPWLEDEVEAALDAVVERFPELFDLNDIRCGNCYLVKDPSRYFDEVIKQLNRQGLCTDGVREELGVKATNDSSEQYDIILASNHMRRAPSSYRGVCRPALF